MQHNKLLNLKRPYSQGWYSYKNGELASDQAIFSKFTHSLKPNDDVFIFMFLWPYHRDYKNELKDNTEEPDIKLATYLGNKNIKGNVFVDNINFDYNSEKKNLESNRVVQLTPDLNWQGVSEYYALPNNLFMWFIHTPQLQLMLEKYFPTFISQSYAFLKLASNHQKVVVINENEAWIGSRNFNRSNWNNQDHFLEIEGFAAKIIFNEAVNTIVRLNPSVENLTFSTIQNTPKAVNLENNNEKKNLAKILRTSEIKPTILHLIKNATHIDGMVSLLTEPDSIAEINTFLERKGRLRLILDPNNYIFFIKWPYLPNIIPLMDIETTAELRLHKTKYQMHTKAALFTLKNGSTCYLGGSANWTTGAIERLAYNDLGILLCNDTKIIREFNQNFSENWNQSLPRETIDISHKFYRYGVAKILTWLGINPW